MAKLVVVIGDTHINSTIGLAKQSMQLSDGGYYVLGEGQLWLANKWADFWEKIEVLKESGNFESTILILNGDIVDINVHAKHQLVTPNIGAVVRYAYDILLPKVKEFDKTYLVKGTRGHTGELGEVEEILAQMLNCERHEATGEYTHWELNILVDNILLDISHFGSLGRLPWTRVNSLMSLGARIVLDAFRHSENVPNIVIRSHRHQYSDTYDNISPKIRVISCPAWQLATEYAKSKGIFEPADIGGLAIVCESGKAEVHPYVWNARRPEPIIV